MPTTTGKIYLGNILISSGATSGWVRPSDWIAMPTITPTEQKVAALFLAGDSNSNFVAFRCSGNYTVNWGDGITENVAAGVTAQHNYVFSSLSASTELGPTGSKMRQAMIVITPQAGQNLTSISFNFTHSSLGATTYTTPILEIALSAPNCTTLVIGGAGGLRLLQQCTILSHKATNMVSMFSSCFSLQSVPLFNTSAVTVMSGMFSSCYSLQSVPLFNTSAVTNMGSMFSNCYSLQSVPLFNTSAVTNMSSMFSSCFSLQSVPLFNTSAVTSMGSMFSSCYSIRDVPLFNTANVINNMINMFSNCFSLPSIPLFNTAAVTSMGGMFSSCLSLQSVPALNCSSSTSMSSFVSGCSGLKRCQATGIKSTVSFANCALSATNLNEIYTNLADLTSLPTQTITVTGNYGVATDNPAIATAKKWTVVG
jgi:surface protein